MLLWGTASSTLPALAGGLSSKEAARDRSAADRFPDLRRPVLLCLLVVFVAGMAPATSPAQPFVYDPQGEHQLTKHLPMPQSQYGKVLEPVSNICVGLAYVL